MHIEGIGMTTAIEGYRIDFDEKETKTNAERAA